MAKQAQDDRSMPQLVEPAPAPIYLLEELAKAYGGRQILHVGRLEIQRGEMLAVVGPSGAGKSTLLRLLNFLESPSRGRLHYDGRLLPGDRPAPLAVRRQVTTVFQQPRLLNRSVAANVRYGLQLRRARAADGIVEEVLEEVGLTPLAGQNARSLSGGEAQRVAVARALVLGPSVLLLDEPTANLDPYNVGLIEAILRNHNRRRGTTMVLVTHNIFQARRLADRVALLLSGGLVEVSSVETFFENPADQRTAAFVRGDMVY